MRPEQRASVSPNTAGTPKQASWSEGGISVKEKKKVIKRCQTPRENPKFISLARSSLSTDLVRPEHHVRGETERPQTPRGTYQAELWGLGEQLDVGTTTFDAVLKIHLIPESTGKPSPPGCWGTRGQGAQGDSSTQRQLGQWEGGSRAWAPPGVRPEPSARNSRAPLGRHHPPFPERRKCAHHHGESPKELLYAKISPSLRPERYGCWP